VRLDDEELAIWGGVMFIAGQNRAEGKNDAALQFADPQKFQAARDIAARELPAFKKLMKKRRIERPVS